MAQTFVHYSLHFLFPGLIAWLFFRKEWRKAWLILLATMLVDLDHLLAYPQVFVPDRCGIGFHPLHSSWAIAIYVVLLIPTPTRLVALGLLMHMATDLQDCWWMERAQDPPSRVAANHCPSSFPLAADSSLMRLPALFQANAALRQYSKGESTPWPALEAGPGSED